MVKRPGDNMGAALGECCQTSVGAFKGSMSGAIFEMRGVFVGAGESESEELLIQPGVSRGDREGVKVGREDDGEFIWALGIWDVWRHVQLHVVRGVVLEGWRDSLGNLHSSSVCRENRHACWACHGLAYIWYMSDCNGDLVSPLG